MADYTGPSPQITSQLCKPKAIDLYDSADKVTTLVVKPHSSNVIRAIIISVFSPVPYKFYLYIRKTVKKRKNSARMPPSFT